MDSNDTVPPLDVVGYLEQLLGRARAGELIALAVVAVNAEGDLDDPVVIGPDEALPALLDGADALADSLDAVVAGGDGDEGDGAPPGSGPLS